MDAISWVTIIVVALGAFAALLRMLRNADLKRIDILEKEIVEIKKVLDDMHENGISVHSKTIDTVRVEVAAAREHVNDAIQKHQVALDSLTDRHEDSSKRFGASLDRLVDQVADIRETIAGFGQNYISRRECERLHGELISRRECERLHDSIFKNTGRPPEDEQPK